MTNTTSHANCIHPKTKSARATCRRQTLAAQNANSIALKAIIDGYYSSDNYLEAEELGAMIMSLAAKTGNEHLKIADRMYYGCTHDLEEIIAYVAAKVIL